MLLNILMIFSLTAAAEAPQFTVLGKNQCAPYEGALFNKEATAELLTIYNRFAPACDARVAYELGKQKEDYNFQTETLKIEHKALTQEYNLFIKQKDKEIAALVKSLEKTSPRNKLWWFVGGAVAGSITTYGVHRGFSNSGK
jgi:hypothetical protein